MTNKAIKDTLVFMCILLAMVIGLSFGLVTYPWWYVDEIDEPMPTVNDRAVIENKDSIWSTLQTGYTAFKFDNEYYIIENLPKEYIDYSAWKCRLE